MGITIACAGCGQSLQIAPDDSRPEVECLWCGCKTTIPPPAGTGPSPVPTSNQQAAPAKIGDDVLPSDDLAIAPAERAAPRPRSDPPTPGESAASARPWHEQAPYSFEEPQPQPAEAATRPATASPPPLPRVDGEDNEDDDRPYVFDGRQDRPCPECGRFVACDAALCLACGYDFKSGKRLKKTYEPISRSWESGWPLATRKMLFIILQAVALSLSLVGAFSKGNVLSFFGLWSLFTAMTLFLLGTFSRVELSRTKKGKVTLKQIWWGFFQERPAQTIPLSEYDGVTSGTVYRADFWDWMVTVVWLGAGVFWGAFVWLPLLGLGLLMAILWWHFFVNKETFYVALTKDHGHPALNLYRGWSEPQMRNMADTIKDIAFTSFV